MPTPSTLWNRNFLLLWQGQLVSKIGSQAYAVAMMFWIKHATGSATLMGLIMMVSALPAVILGPFAGTFADRHSRRWILIGTDLISGISVLILAVVMFTSPDATSLLLVLLFVVSLVVSISAGFFQPAIGAAIPDLVPRNRVAAANSMSQFSVQIATFLGQGTGGVLFRLLGAPVLFLVDGISYIFSAVSEMFIQVPQTIPEKANGWRQSARMFLTDTREGLRFVWTRVGLRNLIIVAAFLNFFLIPIIVLMPFYVEDVLAARTDWFGFLMAGFGGGAMVGYGGAGGIQVSGRTRATMTVTALIVMSLLFGGLGLVRTPPAALLILILVGTLNGYININIATIMQLTTPSEIRGRVFGLMGTLAGGLAPIAMGLTGTITDLVDQNVPLIYVACGCITAALSVVLSLGREFRDFMAFEPPPEAPEEETEQ